MPALLTKPVVLRRSKLAVLENALFVILPLLPLALVVATSTLDTEQTSDWGTNVQQSLLLAPTIFPIMFAAVCGRLMKSIAAYKSQTGARIGLLEHLVGAQSMFSSLERFIVLRNFTFAGIAITIVWALSPLGGQAFLRILSIEEQVESSMQVVTYLGSDFLRQRASGPYAATLPDDSIKVNELNTREFYPWICAFYTASLLAPPSIQNSPRDLWNNVKVPLPRGSISTNSHTHLIEEWINITSDTTARYSNLVGIQLSGLANGKASTFTVSSLQLDVHCTNTTSMPTKDFFNQTEPLLDRWGTPVQDGSRQKYYLEVGNATSYLFVSNASWYALFEHVECDLLSCQPIGANTTLPSLRLFYGSMVGYMVPFSATPEYAEDNPRMSIVTFEATPVRLESRVKCSADGECAVDAVRQVYANMTWEQFDGLSKSLTSSVFPSLGIPLFDVGSSVTESFLASTPAIYIGSKVNLWASSLDALSDRMTLALNTYWYLAFVQDNSDPSRPLDPGSALLAERQWPERFVNVTADTTEKLSDIYATDKIWLIISFVVVILLEALAIAGTVLSLWTRAPDILGYVSSMTMSNEHCKQQRAGASTALDGLGRARAMKDVEFVVTDSRGQDDVGQIAFVPIESGVGINQHAQGSGLTRSEILRGRLYQ